MNDEPNWITSRISTTDSGGDAFVNGPLCVTLCKADQALGAFSMNN